VDGKPQFAGPFSVDDAGWLLRLWGQTSNNEHRTTNIERRTSNAGGRFGNLRYGKSATG
jgi:hypothetical protein